MQTIGMYLMHLPLYVMLITLPMPADTLQESFTHALLIAFLVMTALMIPICVLNVVVSIRSALKGEEYPTKVTMIAKLSLIPWYLFNLAICIVFASIFLNPFMFLAIPLIVACFVGVTYLLMFATSIGEIVYFIKKKAKKEHLGAATIVGVIFLFVFCLDVVGAIILYRRSKKVRNQAQPDELDTPLAEN